MMYFDFYQIQNQAERQQLNDESMIQQCALIVIGDDDQLFKII